MRDNYELNTVIAVGPDPDLGCRVFQKWVDNEWFGLGRSDEPWTLREIRELWPSSFSVIWSPGDDD